MPCTDMNSRTQAMNAMKQRAPDISRAFAPFFQSLMKEGSLSIKHKELIALGIGVALRCDACIDAHVDKSFKAGATEEEILEAAGVAVMMGGGPAYTAAPRVVTALERLNSRTDAAQP